MGVFCRFLLTRLNGWACDDCWRFKCLSCEVKMYAVGRIGSYISRGVDTVAAPFHPFGGAVDMIVVRQADGSLKSSPWYVRFGKFQGVLKTKEKVVNITVNGVDADFHMYLDHKGEAYFLSDVNVEEEEAGFCRSSSGEDTDKQARSKRLTKSDSFETKVKQPNSARQADGRDDFKREHDAWSASRRARILGLVFGSRSFKERMAQQSPEDEDMKRARLLERAEIAADLLELKWSTTLSTRKPKKNKSFDSSSDPTTNDNESKNDVSIDKERAQVNSIICDKVEHVSVNSECVNDIVKMELSDSSIFTGTNVGSTEEITEVKSPMKYSLFVVQDSSDSLQIPVTKENSKGLEDDLCNMDADRNNVILDSNSVIGIRLVKDDSVDTEISEVIHPTDVVISRTHEDKITEMGEPEVSESFSHQSSSCSSCISEEEVVSPDLSDTVDQFCYRTNDIDSQDIENKAESSRDDADHHPRVDNSINPVQSTAFQACYVSADEDQFRFSNLNDSKLMELHLTDLTSPHSKSGATCGDSESPKEVDECNAYESFSSSDNVDQPKMPTIVEEHFKIPNDTCQQASDSKGPSAGSDPNQLSDINVPQALDDLQGHCQFLDSPVIHKSDDLFMSGKNASNKVVSPESVDVSDKPWGIWPFTFKRSRSMKSSKPVTRSPRKALSCSYVDGTGKQDMDDDRSKPKVNQKKMKTLTPTAEQLASLNLKEGRNEVTFTFSTAMLGDQRVSLHLHYCLSLF